MQPRAVNPQLKTLVLGIDRFAVWLGGHWLGAFLVIYGMIVFGPFLAPLFMQIGATGPAQAVYFFYSFLCHQLPERSIFLFGPKPMYSYAEIKAVWPLDGFEGLRQFVGNAAMGYKVAWSDRMISTYGGLWLGGVVFALLGKRAPRISLLVWLLVGVLPLGLDGLTHMLNDVLAGTTGGGFRDTNSWLQALTFNTLPPSFYAGDQFGSFNSWARWITGLSFSLTTVLAAFPLIENSMRDLVQSAEYQRSRAQLRVSRGQG
jgi:uncharacterized membrane protein